ncbi:MAG TPA: hypothetical protein EYM34_06895, partial [Alphaproteobacteria bacterium]|nr:hypothetical protein [Alphaproteobacteria bacterium]
MPLKLRPASSPPSIISSLPSILRSIAPFLPARLYNGNMHLSGGSWSAAFILFLIVYAPMLWRPGRTANAAETGAGRWAKVKAEDQPTQRLRDERTRPRHAEYPQIRCRRACRTAYQRGKSDSPCRDVRKHHADDRKPARTSDQGCRAGGDLPPGRARRGQILMSDITELSIAELAQGYRDKSFSPVDAARAYFARIAQHNDKINAFVTLCEEDALAEAKQAETEIAAGQWRGPMHGIPIGHKDLYQTAGVRSTAGSRVLENHVPDSDATGVARLKQAGAVMLGKLNTHEFAYGPTNDSSMFGPCRNPWDPTRFSGGSSGGSGAAVALRLCAGATGSDTGGSIRMPSACCGITGLKPTYGRTSRAGIYPLCWTMDHSGPMTRSAEDAALMFQPMPGPDGRDAAVADRAVPDYAAALDGDIKGLRIGVPTHYFFDRAIPEIAEAAQNAIAVLEGLGAEVREVDIAHIDHAAAAALVLYLSEGTAYHDDHIATIGELYTDQVRLFLEIGNYVLAKDYLHAQRYRTLLGHAMAD